MNDQPEETKDDDELPTTAHADGSPEDESALIVEGDDGTHEPVVAEQADRLLHEQAGTPAGAFEEDAERARLWAGPKEQLPGAVRTGGAPDTGRRLLPGWNRPDPWRRPHDPAGSFPRHEPDALLPVTDEPLIIHASPSVRLPNEKATGGTSAAAAVHASDGPLPEPPQAARFQFVLGAMIAVAVAGLLALVIGLISTSGGSSSSSKTAETGAPWSAWAPTTDNLAKGASQIAAHVGGEYKLPSGRQIAAVTGGSLEVAGLPLTPAIQQTPAQGGQIQLFSGTGVLYRLCGLGDKCSITEGQPSAERHLLLRREALELALYSFRYLKGVNQVVVFMPPKKGSDPSQALFFRPDDVKQELNQPLTTTLTPNTPGVTTMATSPNAQLIDQVTIKSLFSFRLTQANQDTRAFLVLDKIS